MWGREMNFTIVGFHPAPIGGVVVEVQLTSSVPAGSDVIRGVYCTQAEMAAWVTSADVVTTVTAKLTQYKTAWPLLRGAVGLTGTA